MSLPLEQRLRAWLACARFEDVLVALKIVAIEVQQRGARRGYWVGETPDD